MNRSKVFTRKEVGRLIADGQIIIISEQQVLRLDKWLERHPGGRLPILHMVGKDATDQLAVYHSIEVVKQMRRYRIGKIDHPWVDFEPPVSGGVFNLDDEKKEEKPPSIPEAPISRGKDIEETNEDGNISEDEKVLAGKEEESEPAHFSVDPSSEVTDKVQWLNAHSIVSDSFKNYTTKSSPETFAHHAEMLEVELALLEFPSIDPVTQRQISTHFRKLHQKVRESGLYTCNLWDYGKEMIRYTTLFVCFIVALRYEWFLTSAVFLGAFWHQIMFSAHDAGHLAITHNFVLDMIIGIFVADFCCGLSIGWWKSSHNVHHLVPNHPEHDPDIQNVPLFSTSPSFFKSLRSSYYGIIFPWDKAAEVMIPLQKYMYYPIMGLARFNLYFLSWCHLISAKSIGLPSASWTRPLEIIGMATYWFLFGYCLVWRTLPTWPLRVAFVLVSHIATMPLHVQITLSHWGMSTSDLGASESFAQKQLRTTMDVDCPAWLDFIHGGLQFQAVHHLFPRLPRHNLRKAQVLVREFCKEMSIPYTIFGFVDGNDVVLSRLEEISKQLEILAECTKHTAAEVSAAGFCTI